MGNNVQTRTTAPRRSSLIWLVPVQLLSGFAAWAAVGGGQVLRGFLLGGLLWLMALPFVVSLEAGLLGMLLFEPFRGFVRRALYLIVPYTQTDPIHLLTPLIACCAFVFILRRDRLQIFRLTPLAGLTSLLALICVVQIFNPLQGGLFVGLAGALFVFVPMLWFYFGQGVKPEFMLTMLRLVVVLGLITSLHGIYQLAFGFPGFEQYWLDNTEFYESIAVFNVKRALATYNSAEEWGRYIQIGAIVAFGFGATAERKFQRLRWRVGALALCGMLLLTGQRSSIFGLFLGLMTLFLTGARTWRGAARRAVALFIPLLLITVLAKPLSDDDVYSLDESATFKTMVSHSTKGTVNPTGESSLRERFETWGHIVTQVLPSRPLGAGLGAATLGVKRFTSETDRRPIDSYWISLAVACGIPAALLFVWILCRATALAVRAWQRATPGSSEDGLWRIMLALMSVMFLNNFFGNTLTIYSTAPIGWLVIGWIGANAGREVIQPSASPASGKT